jgi:N-acetylglucosamine kinase-like BadF-type ATPase
MSEYFLGVDGGQSSTTAVIADENGRILGWATGGPCNHASGAEAIARFRRVIGECLSRALSAANLPRDQRFRAACLGMSGGPEDKGELLREIVAADRLVVTHDAEIALAGALNGGAGVIVIAGTGSIAFGRNEQGEVARVAGWGHIFGDEGSAFDIVRQALRAALREHEGWGPRTALTPALLEATATTDAHDLLHLWYTPDWPRSRVAALAPLVSRIAEEGDPTAAGVIESAARSLGLLAASVRSQLFSDEQPGSKLPLVSWTGGVFRSPMLLDRFRMLTELGGAHCAEPQHGPAVGALLVAWRTADLLVLAEPAPDLKL